MNASAMPEVHVRDKVALVTGGAHGIGARVAERLAEAGARVVIADVDIAQGERLADDLAGAFVRCDVSRPQDNRVAVQSSLDQFGGLDIAFLNAGVGHASALDDAFDDASYRRMTGVNLDGAVYGLVAVLPALRARGGGDVVVTASLAGLTPMPMDVVYTATKHAVVGLVRSVAPNCAGDNIRVNALCPGFTDTAMIDEIRDMLRDGGMPLVSVDAVADAFFTVLVKGCTGECFFVQPGRASEPFRFPSIPGPRDTGFGSVQAGR